MMIPITPESGITHRQRGGGGGEISDWGPLDRSLAIPIHPPPWLSSRSEAQLILTLHFFLIRLLLLLVHHHQSFLISAHVQNHHPRVSSNSPQRLCIHLSTHARIPSSFLFYSLDLSIDLPTYLHAYPISFSQTLDLLLFSVILSIITLQVTHVSSSPAPVPYQEHPRVISM